MPAPDWVGVFAPSISWLEIGVRGTLMYWSIFLLFRLVLRRDMSNLGVADVLMVVLISDAAQEGMSGGYRSVTDGAVLIGTLVFWNVLIDWLGFRFPAMNRLLSSPPRPLVINGRMQHANLRREFITRNELMEKLREQGVERLAGVKKAILESDGTISVIRAKRG